MSGLFKHDFVTILPLSLSVKEFRKSVNIWGSYRQQFSVLFFLTHGVVIVIDSSVVIHSHDRRYSDFCSYCSPGRCHYIDLVGPCLVNYCLIR